LNLEKQNEAFDNLDKIVKDFCQENVKSLKATDENKFQLDKNSKICDNNSKKQRLSEFDSAFPGVNEIIENVYFVRFISKRKPNDMSNFDIITEPTLKIGNLVYLGYGIFYSMHHRYIFEANRAFNSKKTYELIDYSVIKYGNDEEFKLASDYYNFSLDNEAYFMRFPYNLTNFIFEGDSTYELLRSLIFYHLRQQCKPKIFQDYTTKSISTLTSISTIMNGNEKRTNEFESASYQELMAAILGKFIPKRYKGYFDYIVNYVLIAVLSICVVFPVLIFYAARQSVVHIENLRMKHNQYSISKTYIS